MKNMFITGILVCCATIISELLYWYVFVPQQHNWFQMPTFAWLLTFAPFIASSVFVGYHAKGWGAVFLGSAISAVIAILTRMILLYSTGRPPGHDIGWKDLSQPPYYQITLTVFAFITIVFCVFFAAGHALKLASNRVRV